MSGPIHNSGCTHIMIDLETEGTRAGCTIRQIGAASFNPYTDEIGRRFEINLDLDEQYRTLGLTTDDDTLDWLNKLPPEIQAAMTNNPQPVGEAIIALIRAFDWEHPDMRLWCHGATFDEPILRELILRFGEETKLKKLVPWAYWQVRDTRTILELTNVKVERDTAKAHTGLEDAINQIRAVQAAYKVIRRWKSAIVPHDLNANASVQTDAAEAHAVEAGTEDVLFFEDAQSCDESGISE